MRHLLLQSGKCLTRARFTALLSGRDPITTIVGVLNFLSNTLGLITLKPPKVAPASRIGDSRARSELSILDATPVASIRPHLSMRFWPSQDAALSAVQRLVEP